MGLLTVLFEKRAHPSSHDWDWWGRGAQTYAGVQVTEEGALSLSAVFGCVRVISESVASLPLIVYRRRDRSKERAFNHPLYELLHNLPNPEMTSLEFRETLIAHVATWGNGYAEIEWSNSGKPLALWPLRPDRMEVERKGGELRYAYTLPGGQVVVLPGYRVHHLRGLSGNGVTGYSVIRLAMQGIGLGLATEEFGSRFFSNGARPGAVLKHPGSLSDKAYANLQRSWGEAHQGLSNAHRVRILEEGMDLDTIGIPPEEAQFLETRKFQVRDIARWFRMPPHMIQDLDNATFTNIEHQSLDFVVHTLRPWLVRSEQALMRDLLTKQERAEYLIEYLVDGLLRGDMASRFQAYATGRQWGWYSANDVREMENRNPIAGGDVYLVPLNMVPGGEGRGAPAGAFHAERGTRLERRAVEDVADDRRALASSFLRILEDVFGRVVRREVNDVRRAVQKYLVKGDDTAGFLLWLDEFYEEHPEFVRKNLLPTLETMAERVLAGVGSELDSEDDDLTKALADLLAFVGEYAETLGVRMAASSAGQLREIVRDAAAENVDPAPLLEERLDSWDETTAEKAARRESVRGVNAFAWACYGALAVLFMRWVASGENCPYCRKLDGKTVGIQQFFLPAGDYEPEGADGPLKIRNNVRHPPVHDGCDCMIIAG